MVLWPTDRAAYGRMCRLLSRGRMRCEKGSCDLSFSDIAELSEGIAGHQRPVLATPRVDREVEVEQGRLISDVAKELDIKICREEFAKTGIRVMTIAKPE